MEYRLPRLEDIDLMKSYIEDHYSHSEYSLSASNMLTSMKWEDWVKKVNNNAVIPDEEWGKSLTYLVIDDYKLIGLLSIRYGLPDKLAQIYGHIGYGVRPSERCKGYATKMLKYALVECKKLGMERVILGCYKENIGSAKTIVKNGGQLIRETEDEKEISEYWKVKLISQYYEIKL
ncbi:MAG: GNAT family N-acetyltransferase [Bacilli bacterium]|nr:GNAT family N-acetyltransferase [Bacilli bacterium]